MRMKVLAPSAVTPEPVALEDDVSRSILMETTGPPTGVVPTTPLKVLPEETLSRITVLMIHAAAPTPSTMMPKALFSTLDLSIKARNVFDATPMTRIPPSWPCTMGNRIGECTEDAIFRMKDWF